MARNLGLGLMLARLTTLGVAIFLSAQLVNVAGIIGFVGLFAPLLARMLGARRLWQRLWLAPLLGALLLGLTDQTVLWLTHVWREVPTGEATGVILLLLLMPGDTSAWQLPAGSAGAALTLLVMITIASRGGFSTQRMLLAGIALSTAFFTVLTLLLASGDPRMSGVITWISGSTYGVESEQAINTAGVALVLALMVPVCQRWLRILPLGSVTAQALGVAVTPVRLLILLLASVLTAMATLTVGPLSFVGLMAPHLARMMGFSRVIPQLCCSALIGGILMLLADWAGSMILFPNQVPAGLLATFIGAPYFIYLLRKQAH